jgi:hypothetical protein
MTVKEFSSLSKAKKYVLLSDFGKFMANRKHQGFLIGLFSFEGFYVEVWKRAGLDYIDYIEVVKDNKQLEKYLDDFDVSGELGI